MKGLTCPFVPLYTVKQVRDVSQLLSDHLLQGPTVRALRPGSGSTGPSFPPAGPALRPWSPVWRSSAPGEGGQGGDVVLPQSSNCRSKAAMAGLCGGSGSVHGGLGCEPCESFGCEDQLSLWGVAVCGAPPKHTHTHVVRFLSAKH